MKKWHKIALVVAGTVGAMYAMVCVDVVSRAKKAYLEGEKYWNWSDHPEQHVQFLQGQLATDKKALEEKLSKNTLSKDQYDRELQLLEFDHQQQLKESTIKYAYVWYQTAVDLFSPPDSKWVQLARQKMPLAKERWKAELRAKKIPFEDYMID
ncbi:MAG: hypothetical protein A2992_00520 [Elusimicrobia bacterium RIFCSPLOWO2_01_FULL_59_12]|nr:MAG: hypothetical protein A2992_00520 [Elusimicrobia bacterium RIFCSPLOWO2_01_FULL_59_12]